MIDESTIREIQEEAPGYTGPLFDETPRVTAARTRPFIWALLLLSAAVRTYEVVCAMTCHVHGDDVRVGDDPLGRTPLEAVVEEVIGELVDDGLLRPRGDGLFVLNASAKTRAITTACALNAQLPDHLLSDIAAEI